MSASAPSPEQLIAKHQGLVHSLAWRIHRKVPAHVEVDDLVGYGQVGLAQAARDFDPSRGVQFTTFAYHRIRGAILDGLAEMDWFKRSHFYRGRYERLANEFLTLQTDDGSHEPGLSRDENLRWFRDAASALAMVYLFCQQGGEEGGGMEVEDKTGDTPQSALISRELKEKLHELIETLPRESAELIRATYFEGLSLTEAGQRLGVSKSWASRLHSRTLDTLAKRLRMMQLAD
jgi:RNA polymerase sigma factor for flagellar operon FliA